MVSVVKVAAASSFNEYLTAVSQELGAELIAELEGALQMRQKEAAPAEGAHHTCPILLLIC